MSRASDAQDLAVHASITTVKVKNTTPDPELEGIGPAIRGAGLWPLATFPSRPFQFRYSFIPLQSIIIRTFLPSNDDLKN